MKVEVDVNMTTGVMYDYMMYHTLTGAQFYMALFAGVMLVAVFCINSQPLYLIAGIAAIAYLPVERYIQAKKQVGLNPVFKETIHYVLDDEKISVDVLNEHNEAEWDSVIKVRSTGKSLILYTSRVAATILPKESLGADYEKAVELIKKGVPAERVRIHK
ncbi:MAG: YcxB family protein [Lachnospiraceae bacterium]|nr:YcxB family protein [Lachnospiraceae bacterium]